MTSLPPQDAFSEACRRFFDEGIGFQPAHALAAHRPLGGIMRARHRRLRAVPGAPPRHQWGHARPSAFNKRSAGLATTPVRPDDEAAMPPAWLRTSGGRSHLVIVEGLSFFVKAQEGRGFDKLSPNGILRMIRSKTLANLLTAAVSACLMTSCAPPAHEPALAASAPAALLTWPDLLARSKPAADKTFRYGSDPYQVADLWLPKGKGPHPVVLMVHGGCWTTSIADRSLMNWAAADLRGRGIAVWNIDYRGVDRPGGAPDGIFMDVGAAADLLRTHAGAERLDARRVVAVGHSAGGHLALWLAARPRVTSVALRAGEDPLPLHHVVSLGGLPDLAKAMNEPQGCGNAPIEKLLESSEITVSSGPRVKIGKRDEPDLGPFARGGAYANKSIPLLAPLGVPQTLINGDADRIIPTHFAADYATFMRAKGDKVAVTIVPRQGHVELIAPGTPAWAAAVQAIENALGR